MAHARRDVRHRARRSREIDEYISGAHGGVYVARNAQTRLTADALARVAPDECASLDVDRACENEIVRGENSCDQRLPHASAGARDGDLQRHDSLRRCAAPDNATLKIR